jgi:hypothetical protein
MDKKNEKKNVNNDIGNINNNVSKVQKKKKKKKHGFLKFLLVVLLLFILIKLIKWGISYYNEKQFDEFVKENILVNENEEIKLTESELKEDTNGDGLTNEEKIRLGLDILSDDTDGDGLTDYDEIYVYGSDPTKYSTSGDVLSDAYKIAKGYDINTYYSDSTVIKVTDNMSLTLDDAKDIEAYYKEYTGSVPSKYTIAMTPFRVYSFTGQIEVKIDNPEYYEVISYDNINKEETELESNATENALVFEISNDNPILIVYKEDMVSKINDTINSKLNFNNSKDSEYVVIATPIFNMFFGVPVYIFEVNDLKVKNNNNVIIENKLNSKSEKIFTVSVSYISSFGAKVLDFIFGRLENQLATYAETEDSSWISYFIIYKHLNSSINLENYLFGESTEEEQQEEDNTENVIYEFENKYSNTSGAYYADSGFSVTVNAFNFANLSTTVSNGGVCLGFAHFTTNIYNNGNISKTIKKSYDLSSNSYNIIWNKKLYSYQASSDLATYADDIKGNEPTLDSATMDEPDAEVVKALEYYWDTLNSKLRFKKFSWAWNAAGGNQTYISSDTIDNLVENFKNGKIVTLILCANSQHAINAYKIVESEDDSDILYLKAYDNNFPADMWWNKARNGKEKYDITITLKRCYKNTLFGGVKTYYLYDYNPLNNDSYYYSSINGGTDYIIFIDENGNSI